MTRNANKNIREPLGHESTPHKLSKEEKIRMAMGKQKNLDPSFYERLEEYRGKQLFWENDIDGAVEKWLHLGAILVSRQSKSMREFKGFTDRASSEYERVPVGSDAHGNPVYCYLMAMDKDEYQEIRIDPKHARNQEIMNALGQGKSQTDGQVMPDVKGLKTYAPNLPTGGKGFEQTHDA